jgi:sigma-B regulation protein RsbU (phosphoserine phosphatase)
MPTLVLMQAGVATPYPITGHEAVIGRHPDCDIQLDSNMVSRRHARVFIEAGRLFVEDLGSGNGTYVNGGRVIGPTLLKHGDRLKVGPVLLQFEDEATARTSRDTPQQTTFRLDIAGGARDTATITSALPNQSGFGLLDVRPEAKLKSVIEISRRLAATADLNSLLPTLLDTLFEIFPTADRGVVLLRSPESGRLVPAAQKHRREDDEETIRLSRTVVNKVIEEKTGVLSADAANDQQFQMSESISSLEIRSIMCAPLIGLDGEVTGLINLDTRNPVAHFTHDDLDLLLAVAGQAALVYESARLLVSHIEKLRQDDEMEIARGVQRALLPEFFPDVTGYEFFATYESAEAVGGDYYDAFPLPDGRICLSFGDVAGKGVPGALLMSRLASCVQNVMRYVTDVGEAFAAINEHMCAKMAEGRFVTYVLAVIDPQTNELTLSNGGHSSPLIRKADGSIEEFDDTTIGLPIGVVEDYPYEVVRRPLAPGETVVITTDGVDEAMNPHGALYTRERTRQFLRTAPPHARELTLALLSDVRRHAAGRAQNDDIAIMAFGRLP